MYAVGWERNSPQNLALVRAMMVMSYEVMLYEVRLIQSTSYSSTLMNYFSKCAKKVGGVILVIPFIHSLTGR